MYKSRKALRLKPLASRRGVAKARAAAGLVPRRNGAQPGNDNRLIHGRYSRAFRARHRQVGNLLRNARTVIDQLTAAAAKRLPRYAGARVFIWPLWRELNVECAPPPSERSLQ